MKRLLILALALSPAIAGATSLDITTEYRMRALSYNNLSLGEPQQKNSFISQSARLGVAINDILLRERDGVSETLDIVFRLRALGVTGSTAPLTAPFDRIAQYYPSADFTPFFEHAFLAGHNLAGLPWEWRFGRQPVRLGSGLLLDDNGAGLTGLSVRGGLPWAGLKGEAFYYHGDFRTVTLGPGNVDFYGFSLELPTEGTWQFNTLIEQDNTTQLAATGGTACPTNATYGCLVSGARRWFSSLRYQLNYGPIVFDGEAAIQKGAATPTGLNPATNHITYNGNGQYVRAKWRQTFFKSKNTGRTYRGIARLSLARGSGDDPNTATTDEAFFPSSGRRYDGLERDGLGEFFGATGYDAFGGQSTATVSGLPRGTSGIVAVGIGITPPAYKGLTFDVDYFVFQSERGVGPHRTLGNEMDLRVRYDYRDKLQIRASVASFTAGAGLNPSKPKAKRYKLEAVGRF
jgi:hypothetical protein